MFNKLSSIVSGTLQELSFISLGVTSGCPTAPPSTLHYTPAALGVLVRPGSVVAAMPVKKGNGFGGLGG